jgi:Uncharacterised nucleotidyltransferase/Transglutaminase-like superfamily
VAAAADVPWPRPVRGAVDWARFAELVDRHRVGALVVRSGLLPTLGAPGELTARLRDAARLAAARSLTEVRFAADVVAALGAAGVPVIVLKGPPLAGFGYGDPTARGTGDLDLLVAPDRVAAAAAVLADLGLPPCGDPAAGPVELRAALARAGALPALNELAFGTGATRVDLHWRLFPNARLLPVRPGWLARPCVVHCGPYEVPTLPPGALYDYLALHGCKHGWRRLKWLADLPALAARHPELLPVTGRFPAPDARRAVAAGLLVAEHVFGPFLPADTRAWAAALPGTGALTARSLRALAADDDLDDSHGPARAAGYARARLALSAEPGYRRAEARTWLVYAAGAHFTPTPGAARLARGPARWAANHARAAGRRLGSRARRGAHAGWWVRVRRLRGGRWRVLIEAAAELTYASLRLSVVPGHKMITLLGPPDSGGLTPTAPPTAPPTAQLADERAVRAAAGAVTAMAPRLPWRPTCLRQAIALSRMLRRRGVPNRIHLGAAYDAGTLAAHAWVSVGGRTVLGGAGADRFTQVAAFAPELTRRSAG